MNEHNIHQIKTYRLSQIEIEEEYSQDSTKQLHIYPQVGCTKVESRVTANINVQATTDPHEAILQYSQASYQKKKVS